MISIEQETNREIELGASSAVKNLELDRRVRWYRDVVALVTKG